MSAVEVPSPSEALSACRHRRQNYSCAVLEESDFLQAAGFQLSMCTVSVATTAVGDQLLKDTTYQGRDMGIRKIGKESKDAGENNKTENIG